LAGRESAQFLTAVSDVTLILQRAAQGDPTAAQELLPLVYEELRRLAHAKMARESPGQTLQATALVHEAWLRLGGDRQPDWKSRTQFLAAAAEAMRRILIDNARRKQALRRGGAVEKLSVDAAEIELPSPMADEELLLLNDALEALAAHDSRKAELLKQWCFVGLTVPEAAQALGISERTANRDLAYAKAWLFAEMKRLRG
jgi:RNA polymerase sigma factor (TIGR02999 family)